jgi:hypothetical protein
MMERHVTTKPGRFSRCPTCGHEPRHIEVHGRTLRETLTDTPTLRHMLECRCGRVTAKHPTLLEAETEWGPVLSQRPLALPAPVVPMHRRAGRKEVRHG